MQFPHVNQARYLSRRHAELADLKEAMAAGNLALIQDTGHRWKGSGASYGFSELSKLGEKLESAAGMKDLDQVKDLLAQFETWLRSHPAPGAEPS